MTDITTKVEVKASDVACAFCGSTGTELLSLFGQNLLSSQYYCNNCHTVFEAVRWVELDDEEEGNED